MLIKDTVCLKHNIYKCNSALRTFLSTVDGNFENFLSSEKNLVGQKETKNISMPRSKFFFFGQQSPIRWCLILRPNINAGLFLRVFLASGCSYGRVGSGLIKHKCRIFRG